MSQVQNNLLHNLVQPSLILAAAYFAGSKRFVEYFQGTTQNGLLLSATIGSGVILATQKLAPENESAWQSLARVAACLALSTIIAPYAAKTLNGRADISMPAALRFSLVEGVIAIGLAIVSSRMTTTPEQDLDAQYEMDSAAWKALGEEERTTLAKQFYEADRPPLSFEDASISQDTFDTYHDFPNMTANQLQWHVQMHRDIKAYEAEHHFALNAALQAKELPMIWGELTPEIIAFATSQKEHLTLIHTYYAEHPIELWAQENVHSITPSFNKRLTSITKINDALQAVTAENIGNLSDTAIRYVHDLLSKNKIKTKWPSLTPEQQAAFNLKFDALELKQL